MKTGRNKDKRGERLTAVGLAAIVLVVALACAFYVSSLKTSMQQDTDRYLRELSEHISSMVNDRVAVNFETLAAVSETCLDILEPDEVFPYLETVRQQHGYLRMGVVDRDSIYHTTSGDSVDVSKLEAAQTCLEGNLAITGVITSPVDGLRTFSFGAPLYQDSEVADAVAATLSQDALGELLDVESFGGQGFSHIVDADGSFIVRSNNDNAIQGGENFFEAVAASVDKGYSIEQMRQDMRESRTGMLYFSRGDARQMAVVYAPLEVDGWYLLSIVPTGVTGEKTDLFISMAIVINLILFLLFAGLILLLLYLQRKNRVQLERIAYVDPVTGGRNRAKFELEAGAAIRGAPAFTYALVSLDILQFKLINDAFGSEEGNRTLRYAYRIFSQNLEPGEMAARISADTFNLLLRNGDAGAIERRIERWVEQINRFNDRAQQKYFLPVSSGVYVIDEPGLNLITMQDRANVARKENKKKENFIGKLSSCAFYTDLERQRMVREKEIANRMSGALENGEFLVYFQPKVELENNMVAGAEALVRWQDPERGLVGPNEFIPLFERNGFILKLDLYVFEQVCKLLRRWLDEGKRPVSISVNLSRVHLHDPDFLEPFKQVHRRYDIPPSLIEIELTETVVFENLEKLIEVIRQIHEIGFSCSLDDFGSGYSSLNLLKDVPVDVIKLDREFFAGSDKNERGRHVIEMVLELARKLKLKTVSEGVETIPQVDFLRGAHCGMVQGFVFSRPVPVEEFERLAFSGRAPFV